MSQQAFFDTIFPNFWESLDRSKTNTDSQSMFGDAQVFDWIINVVRPNFIIEIGSWKGHSANHMADVCKKHGLDTKIICVDSFLGGPEHWLLPGEIDKLNRVNGQPTIMSTFLGNTIDRGNEEAIYPLSIDSSGAAEILRHFGFKADLIFVDAAHGYDEVIKDIMGYFPRLSEVGVMFGDDYQHWEVANAVHECAKRLNVQVIVSARKWFFVNEALMRKLTLPDIQLRHSFEGWVHP